MVSDSREAAVGHQPSVGVVDVAVAGDVLAQRLGRQALVGVGREVVVAVGERLLLRHVGAPGGGDCGDVGAVGQRGQAGVGAVAVDQLENAKGSGAVVAGGCLCAGRAGSQTCHHHHENCDCEDCAKGLVCVHVFQLGRLKWALNSAGASLTYRCSVLSVRCSKRSSNPAFGP